MLGTYVQFTVSKDSMGNSTFVPTETLSKFFKGLVADEKVNVDFKKIENEKDIVLLLTISFEVGAHSNVDVEGIRKKLEITVENLVDILKD